ncbi:hypothetical protein ACFVU3_31910 [Streptomyces sp. NPDC058052]|uniref:hypothetical protein n=1 Tax=Streptomyces sp. NPDC058052 TaxID=3346316 RepID=UPI0036E3EC9F
MSAPVIERLVVSSGADLMDHMVAQASVQAQAPATDLADLSRVLRAFHGVHRGESTRVPLGGGLFDVVITSAGAQARRAVERMDLVQSGCGPVVEDPGAGWLYWLVPPGAASRWEPHSHAVCVGAPYMITLPTPGQGEQPGPFWLRPQARDRLVPVKPLREALTRFLPEPTPHADLDARFGITH